MKIGVESFTNDGPFPGFVRVCVCLCCSKVLKKISIVLVVFFFAFKILVGGFLGPLLEPMYFHVLVLFFSSNV